MPTFYLPTIKMTKATPKMVKMLFNMMNGEPNHNITSLNLFVKIPIFCYLFFRLRCNSTGSFVLRIFIIISLDSALFLLVHSLIPLSLFFHHSQPKNKIFLAMLLYGILFKCNQFQHLFSLIDQKEK